MTLQELSIEHNLSGEELVMCSNYLIALKIRQLKLDPDKIFKILDNFERIEKAISLLNYAIL